MILLISQMLGCLIVAAGIGGIIGWSVRNLSSLSLERDFAELTMALRKKDQALDAASHCCCRHLSDSALPSFSCCWRKP